MVDWLLTNELTWWGWGGDESTELALFCYGDFGVEKLISGMDCGHPQKMWRG